MHFQALRLMVLKFPVFELKSEGSRLNENTIYNIRLLFSQIRTHPYLSNSASLLNQSSIEWLLGKDLKLYHAAGNGTRHVIF